MTDSLNLTWWGHATVGIEIDGARLLTDPVLNRWIGPLRRTGPLPSPDAASGLDAVLISHGHHDHLDLPSLRRIDRATPVVLPVGRGELVSGLGFEHVVELPVGESIEINGVQCVAVPAHHTGARWRGGTSSNSQGYLLNGSRSVWFAGDTGLFDGLNALRGRVDVGLVPIGGWGPTLGHEHLSAVQAAQVCAALEISTALPIHWGTFAVPSLRQVPAVWRHQDVTTFVQELPRTTTALTPRMGEHIAVV